MNNQVSKTSPNKAPHIVISVKEESKDESKSIQNDIMISLGLQNKKTKGSTKLRTKSNSRKSEKIQNKNNMKLKVPKRLKNIKSSDLVSLFDRLSEKKDLRDDEESFDNLLTVQCKICKNQRISRDDKQSHLGIHKKSNFIKNLMEKLYSNHQDSSMIFCHECHEEGNNSFHRTMALQHLFEEHIEEFKGHEVEILKQIDFFIMIKRLHKARFDEITGGYNFSFQQLQDFTKLYFSKSKEDEPKRKILLGRMFKEFLIHAKSMGSKFRVHPIIKSLVIEYNRHNQPYTESAARLVSNTTNPLADDSNIDLESDFSNKRIHRDPAKTDKPIKKVKKDRAAEPNGSNSLSGTSSNLESAQASDSEDLKSVVSEVPSEFECSVEDKLHESNRLIGALLVKTSLYKKMYRKVRTEKKREKYMRKQYEKKLRAKSKGQGANGGHRRNRSEG